jgi:thiol-disulfide isomerase/thioredoxin
MRTMIQSGLALACLTLAFSAFAAEPAAAQRGIAVGASPAAVVLETLDGEAFDLADVVGQRPVLIEFWASWCHVCLALHPRVVAAHQRYGNEVEFLTVAVAVAQTPARVRHHVTRHGIPGRVLWDARGEAVRAFDAPGTGFIVILDASGRVAYTGTGAEQDLQAALARVVNR